MMKKAPIALLIFMLFFGLLGCEPQVGLEPSGTPEAGSTQQMIESATATVTPTEHPDLLVLPSDLEGSKVVLWHPFTGVTRSVFQDQVNLFNQTNEWGIFVEIHDFPGFDLIQESIENPEQPSGLPDVLVAPPDYLIGQKYSEPPVISLDPYVASALFGLQNEADYFDGVWSADLDSGNRYGIPAYRSTQVMFYNASLADTLGFSEFPQTLDEWKNQACSSSVQSNTDASKSNDGTGGWIVDLAPETWYSWLTTQERIIRLDSQFLFSTPENESTFRFVREVFEDGCAWFAREQKPQEYLREGYALFYSAPVEQVLIQEISIERNGSSVQWEVFPFPGNEATASLIISGYSYGIFRSSPETQMAAWLFIRWMQEPVRLAEIVKASASLPLRQSEVNLLANYGVLHPQWMKVIGHLDSARATPALPEWALIKVVLQDVAWQSLQANVSVDDIPELLRQADATVEDVKAH